MTSSTIRTAMLPPSSKNPLQLPPIILSINNTHTHLSVAKAYTYDRTLENQNGRSFFNATGVTSPFSILTESYS